MPMERCSVCGELFPSSMIGIDGRCQKCLYGPEPSQDKRLNFPDIWGVNKETAFMDDRPSKTKMKTLQCKNCGYKVVVLDDCVDIKVCPECDSPDMVEI